MTRTARCSSRKECGGCWLPSFMFACRSRLGAQQLVGLRLDRYGKWRQGKSSTQQQWRTMQAAQRMAWNGQAVLCRRMSPKPSRRSPSITTFRPPTSSTFSASLFFRQHACHMCLEVLPEPRSSAVQVPEGQGQTQQRAWSRLHNVHNFVFLFLSWASRTFVVAW